MNKRYGYVILLILLMIILCSCKTETLFIENSPSVLDNTEKANQQNIGENIMESKLTATQNLNTAENIPTPTSSFITKDDLVQEQGTPIPKPTYPTHYKNEYLFIIPREVSIKKGETLDIKVYYAVKCVLDDTNHIMTYEVADKNIANVERKMLPDWDFTIKGNQIGDTMISIHGIKTKEYNPQNSNPLFDNPIVTINDTLIIHVIE